MTQRVIEALIGRLITDEGFRAAFLSDPHKTLRDLVERGLQLTPGEKSDCDARVSPMIQGSPLIQPTGDLVRDRWSTAASIHAVSA